jgi:hypothetical protein
LFNVNVNILWHRNCLRRRFSNYFGGDQGKGRPVRVRPLSTGQKKEPGFSLSGRPCSLVPVAYESACPGGGSCLGVIAPWCRSLMSQPARVVVSVWEALPAFCCNGIYYVPAGPLPFPDGTVKEADYVVTIIMNFISIIFIYLYLYRVIAVQQ